MITLAHSLVKELFSPGQEAAKSGSLTVMSGLGNLTRGCGARSAGAGPIRAQVKNSPLPNKGLAFRMR